jgi:hypothetical protein
MAPNQDKLKLGKGSAFVKSQLRRLPQEGDTWEADFCALPKPITQNATHYLGLVVTQPHGYLLADLHVENRPTVNDLAKLLAHAMRRPVIEGSHRPQQILLRGHPQWRELFPHLEELSIDVAVEPELPAIKEAFEDFLHQTQQARSVGKRAPTPDQEAVERIFPALAKWINDGYGHIEIGDQEGFGFVAQALDYGGLVFEDEKPPSLAKALAVLDDALAAWFRDKSIE